MIATAFLLALGPLFIVLLLFDATRRFFESWIAQLATYALVSVLVALVAALLLHVVQAYATDAMAQGQGVTIADAVRVCTAAGLILLLLRQILPIAAGLGSGVALSTFNLVSRSIGQFRRKAGAHMAIIHARVHGQGDGSLRRVEPEGGLPDAHSDSAAGDRRRGRRVATSSRRPHRGRNEQRLVERQSSPH